jgi:hypothetical protein
MSKFMISYRPKSIIRDYETRNQPTDLLKGYILIAAYSVNASKPGMIVWLLTQTKNGLTMQTKLLHF